MTRRLGIMLVALAIIGIFAIPLYNAWVDRRVSPFQLSLPVTAATYTTSTLALEPGYHYQIEISVDNSVRYADCLLGAGSSALSGDCGDHPSILDVAWSLRDDRGQVVTSGTSQGDRAMFGYGGLDNVDVVIGYINVLRPTHGHLTLLYRRSAVALAPLRPTLSIYDPDAAEGAGIYELFLGLLSVAFGSAGAIVLVMSRRRA